MQGSPEKYGYSTDTADYVIILIYCNSQTEIEGFKCSNGTTITQFNKQLNYVNLVFYTSQFDTKTQKIYKISKSQKTLLILDSVTMYEFSFGVVNLPTDTGVLFANIQKYSYTSDYTLSSKQVTKNYVKELSRFDGVLMVQLTLGQIKQEVFIEYPKISEILADKGSIIAWILQISFIVYKYNESIGSETPFINLQYEVSRLQQLITQAFGLSDIRNKLIQVKNIEALVESQGCRNSSQTIKNLPQNLSIYPLTDNQDSDSININNWEVDLIDQTIGLLLQKERIKEPSRLPPQQGCNKLPSEDLKVEGLSQRNSVH